MESTQNNWYIVNPNPESVDLNGKVFVMAGEDRRAYVVCSSHLDHAQRIVKAVNEHTALNVVGRLSAEIEEWLQKIDFKSPTFVQVDKLNSLRGFMREAIANLAVIRNGQ